jgi:transcriptional regulator with XRE-family HTH domain
MITRIREVRRARGMTLDEVAKACRPATTPQTIGRLETGMRTVSIGWLNRIAEALEADPGDLVEGRGDQAELPVVAVLGVNGATAPTRTAVLVGPRPKGGQVAITVSASSGDYRAGDQIWCDMVESSGFAAALNRDVLVPRPGGRFVFGRLIDRDGQRLQLLPPGAGGRQQIVANPSWIAVATKLVRAL